MCNIKGRVLEIYSPENLDETRMAYLYNFKVDRSFLRYKHKAWLEKHLIFESIYQNAIPVRKTYGPVSGPQSLVVYPGTPATPKPNPPSPQIPSVTKGNTTTIIAAGGTLDVDRMVVPDRWMIWLHGTTSRPASREHNLGLSRRRALAVERYIRARLGKGPPYYHIDPFWHGEFFAELLGKSERREDPLDRAVLIAFRAVYPNAGLALGPPAPVNRPLVDRACCSVKLQIEYLEIIRDAWLATDFGSVNASGRRRVDDSGASPDVMSVPHVSPDPVEFESRLRNHGYSDARIKELSENGEHVREPIASVPGPMVGGTPFTNADRSNVVGRISFEIELLNQELSNCSPTDPLGDCSSGSTFAFRKS